MNQPHGKEKFNEAFSRVIKDSIVILDKHNDSATIASVAESVCKMAGEKIDNPMCIRKGECSWFNHAQDPFRYSQASNLPEGFIEP